MTCFRWGQLERGPGGGDGAAHPQVLRRGEEWPRPGGRAGQEGATVQTSGKTRSSCYSSLDHVGYIWMIQNLSNMRMFSVKLPSIDSIEFPSSLVPTGQLRISRDLDTKCSRKKLQSNVELFVISSLLNKIIKNTKIATLLRLFSQIFYWNWKPSPPMSWAVFCCRAWIWTIFDAWWYWGPLFANIDPGSCLESIKSPPCARCCQSSVKIIQSSGSFLKSPRIMMAIFVNRAVGCGAAPAENIYKLCLYIYELDLTYSSFITFATDRREWGIGI